MTKRKAPMPDSAEAKHGEKTIELKVVFWTDGISKKPKMIVPKHGWANGVVRMKRNDAHGIVPGEPIPFNSLMDLTSAIEQLLTREEIVLHVGRQMSKLLAPNPQE